VAELVAEDCHDVSEVRLLSHAAEAFFLALRPVCKALASIPHSTEPKESRRLLARDSRNLVAQQSRSYQPAVAANRSERQGVTYPERNLDLNT
jgi:hypothetical protein